jgi:hypothetical protein
VAFLNLYLLRERNYAVGLVLVTIYGMLNFTPMVLLPPLLQQYAGFPDALGGGGGLSRVGDDRWLPGRPAGPPQWHGRRLPHAGRFRRLDADV